MRIICLNSISSYNVILHVALSRFFQSVIHSNIKINKVIMSNPFNIEVRWNYGIARGNHSNDTVKVTMAILFGTTALLVFASDQVINGPLVYVMTALIIGVCLFGILGIDGCIQDIKAVIDDAPPEEQETNIGKTNKAVPFVFFRVLILIIYVAIGGTQLMMLYS